MDGCASNLLEDFFNKVLASWINTAPRIIEAYHEAKFMPSVRPSEVFADISLRDIGRP